LIDVVLWTFVPPNGRDALAEWAHHVRLPIRERTLVDQKLHVLRSMPFEIVRNTKLLAGPIAPHIYKLRVNASLAVRIMLCRGPMPNEVCYTLLVGAIERGGKLDPHDAPARACDCRAQVLSAAAQRRKAYEGLRRPTTG
jgi:hypothetical protein